MSKTFWNGEPCTAEQCTVIVTPSPVPTWWCFNLAGTERKAVEVRYDGTTFYLDDEDGSGWAKVTEGRGSPGYGDRSLPDDCKRVS